MRKYVPLLFIPALLLLISPALAGGFAVITLDELPREVRAGETIQIALMLRAHGHTPVDGVHVTLEAVHQATGARIEAVGQQHGVPGHYVIDVVFPTDGEWAWTIAGYGPESYLPLLTVLPATGSLAASSLPGTTLPLRTTIRLAALTLIAAAVILALLPRAPRKRSLATAAD